MRRSIISGVVLATAVFLAGCPCEPFNPDQGLFINTATFVPVPTVQTTVRSVSIIRSGSTVTVTKAGATLASVAVPAGMDAYFLVYGTGDRFLLLDFQTSNLQPAQEQFFSQVVVDLMSGNTGGNALPQQSFPAGGHAFLHLFPSPGNGKAFFAWYGQSSQIDDIQFPAVFRSDTGEQICNASPWHGNVDINAKITSTSVEIHDGGNVQGNPCPIPQGNLVVSPQSQNFGTILANATVTKPFTLRDSGTDCCLVASISQSSHFTAVNTTFPLGIKKGDSASVDIRFDPKGDVGTFSETLTVSWNPPNGSSAIQVSGTSRAAGTFLTVKKVLLPTVDSGRFALQIDGATIAAASNVGNGGTTGPQTVSPGSHTVSEVGSGGTSLGDYTTAISGDCAANGSVTLAVGDSKTCIITNLGKPRVTVQELTRPANDPGKFNLLVDGSQVASNVSSGGTGSLRLAPGPHSVSETAGAGTNLNTYAVAFGGACSSTGAVNLAAGEDKTCTITNTAAVDDASIVVTSSPGSMPVGTSDAACVKVTNTGTVSWTAADHLLRLTRINAISLPINTAPLPGNVAPGGTAQVCFTIKCNASGTGGFSAQMASAFGGAFGHSSGQTVVCQ